LRLSCYDVTIVNTTYVNYVTEVRPEADHGRPYVSA
jgi:hypothetical protein